MSESDYMKTQRPVEPNNESVDPEQWCCVLAWEEARADSLEAQLRASQEEVEGLREAFNLAYDHLCDLHFLVSNASVTTSFVKDTIKEIETTAKTNQIFIDKKKEEDTDHTAQVNEMVMK